MKVVLFGLGMIYNKYNKYVDKSTIAFLIDNDVEKQGILINGFKVKSPASICPEDCDYVIIMSKSVQDMQSQLLGYGISGEKIKTYKDIGDLYELPKVHCRNSLCQLDEWMDNHKKNKKIFVMSHLISRNGVAVALMNMSVLLKKQGWDVLYGSYYEEDNLSEELEINEIDYIENIELVSSCEILDKSLRKFDLIIVGTLGLADAARQYVYYDIPIIWWLHECQDECYKRCILPKGKRHVYFYGVGPRVMNKFNEYYPNESIGELLYFLPDIEYYERKKHEKIVFGLIGRYDVYKAWDVFFKAFESLSEEKKNKAEVYIVCPGFDLAETDIKEKVSSIPQLHVLIELTQEEVKKFYKTIDVFVCPSRDDSMPIVVTEAMQNRIPCIVSDHVGQSVYMKNNYGGYVFESENADELAKLMTYCIDNKENVLKKGGEAFEIYQSRFTEKIMQRNLNNIVDKILDNVSEDLISVIIPVYNVEAYVEHCLLSVVNQTYDKLEIIIVDDGSYDGSSMICKSFAEKDSRIVYIRQDNKGVVAARKTGLINAAGKYIVFVDGDDYVEECLVEKLYHYMIQYDVDFVHSDFMINGTSINYIKHCHYYAENDLTFDVRNNILKNYVFEWDGQNEIMQCNMWGCLFKKKFIEECCSKVSECERYGEDLICMCHQIMRCKSMLFIPEAYSHYVMREGSATHPLKLEDALLNEISLYKGIERVLLKYNVSNETIDKCNAFFKRKFVARFMAYVDVNLKTEYTCDYLDELFDKRIVIYGAGNVGKSVYEQITSYEKIKIVGWVDKNYKEIHCDYRNICAPDIIQSLDYDYILIAVENEDIAKQIKENLIESHVEKDDIMWRPYKRSVALTFGKDEV